MPTVHVDCSWFFNMLLNITPQIVTVSVEVSFLEKRIVGKSSLYKSPLISRDRRMIQETSDQILSVSIFSTDFIISHKIVLFNVIKNFVELLIIIKLLYFLRFYVLAFTHFIFFQS